MRIYWNTFIKKYVRPPRNQFPTGTRVYKGFQGSGKTLSMVKYAFDIQKQYPNCIVVSNICIKNLNNFVYIENDKILHDALELSCGEGGMLILLDEAHLYFNKKTGISLDVLTAISQQRKDRKRLVFSSQIWEELDISLRKQVKEIVNCKCFLGKIQVNSISDGETLSYNKLEGEYQAKHIRTEIFKHYKSLYDCYDTRQKIINNQQYNRQPSTSAPIVLQSDKISKKSFKPF